jgi:hypothetical protein
MKKIQLSILSISTAFLLSGCYYDNFKELHPEGALPNSTSGCDTINAISYSAQIKPIMDLACTGCHNSSGSAHDMTTHTFVQADALAGTLYNDVNTGSMPQGGSKLSDCDIAKIKKWVDAGALDN